MKRSLILNITKRERENTVKIFSKFLQTIYLIVALVVITNVHPGGQKHMRRDEVDSVLESASNQSSGSSENLGRIGFAIINRSRTSCVDMCVERRDYWIVKRERDVEESLHCPREWKNAISIYLKPIFQLWRSLTDTIYDYVRLQFHV